MVTLDIMFLLLLYDSMKHEFVPFVLGIPSLLWP